MTLILGQQSRSYSCSCPRAPRVGFRVDGIHPEESGGYPSSASSARSSDSMRKRKPSSAARAGMTRRLPRSSPAMSPSAARTAKAGAGSSAGRRTARASSRVSSAFVTGLRRDRVDGAAPALVAQRGDGSSRPGRRRGSRAPTARRCRRRPPRPRRNSRASVASAPPSRASTMPMRSDSGAHAERGGCARFLFPGDADDRRGSRCRAPPTRRAARRRDRRSSRPPTRTRTASGRSAAGSRAIDSTSARVESMRLAQMRSRRALVSRPPKTGSPARCTTAVAAGDARARDQHAVPRDRLDTGGQARVRGRARRGADRERSASSARTSRLPTRPVAPVTRTARTLRSCGAPRGREGLEGRLDRARVDRERRDHRRRHAGRDELRDLRAALLRRCRGC